MLALPGVQYLATRFGGIGLRRISFDEKFRRGDWNFTLSPGAELVSLVERYANGGDILMLGCGSASLAGVLAPDSYRILLGVDISTEAISRASIHATERIRFEAGDMLTYRCAGRYQVILFSESLYYVARRHRQSLLQRLAGSLGAGGAIIVTIAQAGRYAGLIKMIRLQFRMIEDRTFADSERRLLVFRPLEAGRGAGGDDDLK